MNLSSIKQKIADLPQNPGVYFFRGEKSKILYIGKATNLRSRVSSYFRGAEVQGRSEWISLMVAQVEKIDFLETDSVLEALILESNLIKTHQPKYNTLEKDDKSFSYFVITKEEFPRVLIVRKTDLNKNLNKYICHSGLDPESSHAHKTGKVLDSRLRGNDTTKKIQKKESISILFKNSKLEIKNSAIFGPYASKQQMQVALKIIRRIFPFHSLKQKTEKGCLDFQIGMCPGPYAGSISKEDYQKNIRGIKMILEGKKKRLVKTLEKEMQAFAKKHEFEKAAELRNKIFALNHIRDVALMTREDDNFEFRISNFESNQNEKISKIESLEIHSKFKIQNSKLFRIEAYDISNTSGTDPVGSMVVFENGKPNKSQYRKFKIKTVEGSNDVAMMKEVLLRRFKNDWPMPDLVLLDGGLGHLNMAKKLLHQDLGLAVNLAAVAKGPTRKKLDIRTDSNLRMNSNLRITEILKDNNLLKSIMDEAHRFAISFHRKLRRKSSLE